MVSFSVKLCFIDVFQRSFSKLLEALSVRIGKAFEIIQSSSLVLQMGKLRRREMK